MTNLQVERDWLDAGESLNLTELSRVCEMSTAELNELVEYGALSPLDSSQQERLFAAKCIPPLRTAGRLHFDFDPDLFTVVIPMEYMHRIETLECQVQSLQAKHP
ncbi:MAG TPA: hypothetical protein DCP03_12390 [Polaromonas sp.]|uniref:chaperone modulator CbpM n=1 Tax=Polaromonas sp. UBA4122 TaxID=1947074 RepID=UPI000EE6E602|nr:chaperone modulator CbpM [Polaromonas sp. UBA4122]HAL38855.1 hypothetical protein [Polaromonas sp.]